MVLGSTSLSESIVTTISPVASRKPASSAARFPRLLENRISRTSGGKLPAKPLHVKERVVARAVVDDDDLQSIARIVRFRDRADAALDHRALVERGDHDRDPWQGRTLRSLEWAIALPEQTLQRRVEGLDEDDRAEQMCHAAKQPRRDGRPESLGARVRDLHPEDADEGPDERKHPEGGQRRAASGGFALLHFALSPSDERANPRVLCTRRRQGRLKGPTLARANACAGVSNGSIFTRSTGTVPIGRASAGNSHRRHNPACP